MGPAVRLEQSDLHLRPSLHAAGHPGYVVMSPGSNFGAVLMDFPETIIYDNSLTQWGLAIGVFVLVVILLLLLKRSISKRLAEYAKRTHTYMDDILAAIVEHTKTVFILVVALWAGSLLLDLPPEVRLIRRVVLIITWLIQIGLWSNGVINYWIDSKAEEQPGDKDLATTLKAFGMIAKTVIWVILVLLILDNLPGVDVSTLIASLGVVGIAVALALQGILGDLFASLSIMLDKPFVIGDSIVVGDFQGVVEDIGMKSTRLRSPTGEEIVFSNTDLLESRIRNYRTLKRRRVLFTLSLTYQISPDKLSHIPDIVRSVVESHAGTNFNHAYFKGFGDSALNFEVLYHIETQEFSVYRETVQAVNFDLFNRLEAEDIKLAYPTQTVYVNE
jgi:small-conductance mechanosensitive channel